MNDNPIKRLLRLIFRPSASHMSGRTLAKMILTSLKLHPIALLAQFAGMTSLVAVFWHSDVSRVFLLIWYSFGLVQTYLSLRYVRYFWLDRDRVLRIRLWIRRWTALAVAAGIIWGVAGPALMLPLSGISQVVTVAVVVSVTFASWPVYSCWLPSLTAFTILALLPMMFALAFQFGLSTTLVSAVMVVACAFILYSGRKLNEMVHASIMNDDKNRRLVERLKAEVTQSEKARRVAEFQSDRRSRFFAAANHDIRQPLQAMGIYLDLLRRRSTPAMLPVVEQLVHTSESISTLVEQVLTVTRMEFGRLDLHPEPVSLTEFLEELAQECRPIADKQGLRVRVVSVECSLFTDRLMLKRALKNLLSNAINYSRPDAPNPEVVIAARRLGSGAVTIGVYDCGPGLSPEDRKRIFETFYRGSAGKESASTGFGLGLSIVKGIALQLGAQLSVDSHLGRGSVFRMTFRPDATSEEVKPKRVTLTQNEMPQWSGRVLLLEDNVMVAQAVAEMLRSWGATVSVFHRIDENFEAAMARELADAELFITDFNLGEDQPDGLETWCRVSAKAKAMGRPLEGILLTAVSEDLIETRWRELTLSGAANSAVFPTVLQKPIDEMGLLATLNSAQQTASATGENRTHG